MSAQDPRLTTIAIAPCSALADYEAAIRDAGGEPWVLDPQVDDPDSVAARAGGLLLTGGDDVDPAFYGATPHLAYVASEAGRDAWELALLGVADATGLPLLAICRGMQILNVSRGGTLIQHLPDLSGGDERHRVTTSRTAPAHVVDITAGSLLQRLLDIEGQGHVTVNSRHHQAPGRPGAGLVVTATAPDGVIEALEDPARRFCLGVQWHPENFWRTGEFRGLFRGLVRAADEGGPGRG